MSDVTRCRAACQRAFEEIETAQVNSTTPAIGNRIGHIRTKLQYLIDILAAERKKEIEAEGGNPDNFTMDEVADSHERSQKEGEAVARARINWDDQPSAKEAWALMIYVCDTCQHKERIWNARPHVTPFSGVPCPACHAHMTHAFFGSDVFLPDHRPQKGDLIFIDLPPEIALIHANRLIERVAESPTAPPGSVPPAKELALNYLSDFGGHPPTAVRLLS